MKINVSNNVIKNGRIKKNKKKTLKSTFATSTPVSAVKLSCNKNYSVSKRFPEYLNLKRTMFEVENSSIENISTETSSPKNKRTRKRTRWSDPKNDSVEVILIESDTETEDKSNGDVMILSRTEKQNESDLTDDVVFVESVVPCGSKVPEPIKIGETITLDDTEISTTRKDALRLIVIDGSNVAMGHSQGRFFSTRGLKICIDYFLKRGHTVKAFVPQFRLKRNQATLTRVLEDLGRKGLVVFTPAREVNGKMIVPYDDRYIVQCATEFEGVIVSNDNYRDLMAENYHWRKTIETRLLMWTWVEDTIMFPLDPLGRDGPTLDRFLRFP